MKRIFIAMIVVLASGLWSLPSTARAQLPLVIKPSPKRKLAELPAGPLFWRIENFTRSRTRRRRGPLGVGRRVGGQSLVVHTRPSRWVISGRS